MLKLALRNIWRHKARTGLTLAAIVLGVVGLILSGGFVQDVFAHLREATIYSGLGHLQIARAGYFAQGRRAPYRYMLNTPAKQLQALKEVPHVVSIAQRLNFTGLANNGRVDLPIMGEGIEPGQETLLGSYLTLVEGRKLTRDDVGGIMLGEGLAHALAMHAGDYVNLVVTTPDGALNVVEFKVIGVFRSISKDFDARAVRVLLTAAQEMLATQSVHTLVLALDDTGRTDRVAAEVRQLLPAANFDVKTWYQLADFYQKTVDLYRRQFAVLEVIVLVMVLLSVANSVNMAIHERTGEYGTLKALGTNSVDVFRLIAAEYVFLGLIGAGLGVGAGLILAWLISLLGIPMPPPPNMNTGYIAAIRVEPSVAGMAFLVGVAATFSAALLPAWRASRLPIVTALSKNL